MLQLALGLEAGPLSWTLELDPVAGPQSLALELDPRAGPWSWTLELGPGAGPSSWALELGAVRKLQECWAVQGREQAAGRLLLICPLFPHLHLHSLTFRDTCLTLSLTGGKKDQGVWNKKEGTRAGRRE